MLKRRQQLETMVQLIAAKKIGKNLTSKSNRNIDHYHKEQCEQSEKESPQRMDQPVF